MNKKKKLKVALIQKEMTVKDVSNMSGVKYWSLCQYIGGRWNLSLEEKERISRAVGLPPGELFED